MNVPIILDQHNVDREVWWNQSTAKSNFLRRRFCALNAKRTESLECESYPHFAGVISVSADDRDRTVNDIGYSGRVLIGENGVDTEYFSNPTPDDFEPSRLAFVGTEATRNRFALSWFLDNVWPALRMARGDVTLHVIGNWSESSAKPFLSVPGVSFSGPVPDVRPLIGKAGICVLPFPFGYGTKLKVLEAMAMQKAVVSTSAGVHGIPVIPDEHVIVRDNPEELARALLALMCDSKRSRCLADNAQRFVRERYTWESIGTRIREFCEATVREAADRTIRI